jgi:predicted double-glycine peptidase
MFMSAAAEAYVAGFTEVLTKAGLDASKVQIHLPSSRQQTNYTCGAAALRSIARYYGKDLKNEKAWEELCSSGTKKGTHPEDIVAAAESLGFDAKMKEGMTIAELTKHIKARHPVIVAIQAWSNADNPKDVKEGYKKLNDGHYVVAIGYDKKNIYFEDPSVKGSRAYIPRKEFMERWIDREAYVSNPVKKQLGIIITSPDDEESKIQVMDKAKKLD